MTEFVVNSRRTEILARASMATGNDRSKEYGDPKLNLGCAQSLKDCMNYFADLADKQWAPGEREAIELVITKLSRIITGPAAKEDTYVDGAAYFAIAGECALYNSSRPDAEQNPFTWRGPGGVGGEERHTLRRSLGERARENVGRGGIGTNDYLSNKRPVDPATRQPTPGVYSGPQGAGGGNYAGPPVRLTIPEDRQQGPVPSPELPPRD